MSRKRIPLIALSLLASAMASGPAPALPDPTPHKLSISKTGSGTGTVKSAVGGIDCGGKCSNEYSPRVPVRLEARNGTGFFVGWSGDCQGTSPVCNLVMDASKNVTAKFELPKLKVRKDGVARDYQIVSSRPGIDCGGSCTANFDAGNSVLLEAKGGPAGTFPKWPGGGTSRTYNVSMKELLVEVPVGALESFKATASEVSSTTRQFIRDNGSLPFKVLETNQRCELRFGEGGGCQLALEKGRTFNLGVEGGGTYSWYVIPGGTRCQNVRQCAVTISKETPTSFLVSTP